MAVITFSRVYGTGGRELGQKLADRLGYSYLSKDLLAMLSKKVHTTPEKLETFEDPKSGSNRIIKDLLRSRYPMLIEKEIDEGDYIKALRSLMRELADRDNVIIVGRGGQCILADRPGTYHFRLVADLQYRVNFLKEVRQLDYSSDEALIRIIEKEDEGRKKHLKTHCKVDWDDPSLYHLIINLSRVSVSLAEELIIQTVQNNEQSIQHL